MNYEAMTKGVLMTCVQCRGFVPPKGRQVQVYVRRRVSDLPLLCNCWKKNGCVFGFWMKMFGGIGGVIGNRMLNENGLFCMSLPLDETLNGFVYIEQVAFFFPLCA